MKIVITGASGCVGQALVPSLVSHGHDVMALVRRRLPLSEDEGVGPRYVECDLARPVDLSKLPAKADAVIHLAQSRRYRDFPEAADETFAINTAAALDLARYAVGAGARSYVYASSGSVYVPRPRPVDEAAPTAPASFYAASKLAAEAVLAPFSSRLSLSRLRFFYVYGPGQSGMLTDGLASRIRRGEAITLNGADGITICPSFSGDVARVARVAAERAWSGVFNVGAPGFVTLREYAGMIGETLGLAPKFETLSDDAPCAVLPELAKLATLYGLENFVTPKVGLRKTFETPATRRPGDLIEF